MIPPTWVSAQNVLGPRADQEGCHHLGGERGPSNSIKS